MFDAHKGSFGDLLLRGAGIVSLICGWLLMRWLFHSAGLRLHHDPSLVEFAAAALGFLCLSGGGILTTLGEHIFDHVEISERWARRAYDIREEKRGTFHAFQVMPDGDFIASISKPLSNETSIQRGAGPWSSGGGNAKK